MPHSRTTSLIAILLLAAASLTNAQNEKEQARARASKADKNDFYSPFLINGIFNYYGNNGDGSFNPFSTDDEGFEFLKGSGKHVIFEDGIIWGGFQKDSLHLRVGGSMYRHGLQAGPILSPGLVGVDPIPADPSDPAYRVYRVRPDINPRVSYASVRDKLQSEEVAFISRYQNVTAPGIYAQYVADWNEWPASLGAPFAYGVDDQGRQRSAPDSYDPRFDTPGQRGADQTLWYVANDVNSAITNNFSGSPPMGIEMQRTIWGYNRSGVLQNTIFMSTRIINKSSLPIDSMFIGQFSDPDVGDAGDDCAGCDTTLALGYAYNGLAVDFVFGAGAPAVGYAIVYGPAVPSPGDTAVVSMKWRTGYRNLSMTSFLVNTPTYFDAYLTPVWLFYYRVLNGCTGYSGAPMINPVTNQITKFFAPGDPIPPSNGWVDGTGGLEPQDRRLFPASGPFTMAPGDTQEIVIATLAGAGPDRLSSVAVLKAMTRQIQSAAKSLFALPVPPPAPQVNLVQLDREIVLTWGDPASIAQTEDSETAGFRFEGYKVYEYADANGSKPALIASYDRVNGVKTIADTIYDASTGFLLPIAVQKGTDNGISRSIRVASSAITHLPLANGSNYYFGVTAYSYSPEPPALAGTHALESLPVILQAIPHGPDPGTRFSQDLGDMIHVDLTTAPGVGKSDGSVFPLVIDPTRLTGHAYSVTFRTDTSSGQVRWDLYNITKSQTALRAFQNQSGDDDYPVIDGVKVKVVNPPPGMKRGDQFSDPDDSSRWGWKVVSGQPALTPAGADPRGTLDLEGFTNGGTFAGAIGNAFDHWNSEGVPYTKLANVLIRFAQADGSWNPLITPPDPNFSRGYRYVRHADTGPAGPWIVNRSGGYAFQDYHYGAPFSAWNMDASPPARLSVGYLENNDSTGRLDGKYWPPLFSEPGVDNALTREWFFIFDAPYSDTTALPGLMVDLLNTQTPLMWFGIPCRSKPSFVSGDQFEILASHPNLPGNTFTFATIAPITGDPLIARIDVTKINVFPNPCFGYDPSDPTRLNRAVTFTHLPTRATIRIYTLAGYLVRSLLKDDASQFAQWDLMNDSGWLVGTGIYVIYIEMPDLGSTKTLKLGVIAAAQ